MGGADNTNHHVGRYNRDLRCEDVGASGCREEPRMGRHHHEPCDAPRHRIDSIFDSRCVDFSHGSDFVLML